MKILRHTPKISTNPFIDIYPKLDVHGETSDSVLLYVDDFIKDNLKLKKYTIVVVHGIGEGILKKTIHEYLKTHDKVLEYKLDSFNLGTTIIKLKEKDLL